jgi:hypothetical protein
MITVKTIPVKEKLDHVLENSDIYESFLPNLIVQHLGSQAVQELRQSWSEGLRPIPPGTPVDDQYEIAYANWIWLAQTNLHFIREKMGEEGLRLFEDAEVEALKRQNSSPSLWMLALIRAVAPGTAFRMTARNFAYQLQWLTPFTVVDLSKRQFVASITRCKILGYPGSEEVCQIGCQQVYPHWVREQFKVQMSYKRKDHSCTCLVTPLNS